MHCPFGTQWLIRFVCLLGSKELPGCLFSEILKISSPVLGNSTSVFTSGKNLSDQAAVICLGPRCRHTLNSRNSLLLDLCVHAPPPRSHPQREGAPQKLAYCPLLWDHPSAGAQRGSSVIKTLKGKCCVTPPIRGHLFYEK